MAIVNDPDLLDRQQVIFGTNTQNVSFYPVGALRFNDGTDGSVTADSATFNSTTYTFAAGDVGRHIIIQTGNNIGSYEIITFTDVNNVVVDRVFGTTEATITFNVAEGSTAGTTTFTDLSATFVTDSVAIGDVLCLFSGADAGHYKVASITSETALVVETFTGFTAFGTSTEDLAYTIHLGTGGTGADGATEQAMYSFSKEEWRADSMQFNQDDLIKHEFPFEAITSEQFEIGGGAAHAAWTWHGGVLDTDTAVHYIRTGGWADKNALGNVLKEYTGIVTLGTIAADAQVYYQQVDETTAPTDFVLPGAVNQAIQTVDDPNGDGNYADGYDRRNYLKLFVRQKYKTYAQSEIDDIGVSAIQTIVNRFPLAHNADTAITTTDGDIIVTAPFTNAVSIRTLAGTKTDGVSVASTGTFTSATAQFVTSGVKVGDALRLTAGADAADLVYWHIIEVVSETEITVSTADAFFVGDTAVTFDVYTNEIIADRTDGAIADVDTVTGTLSSVTAGFTAVVAAGDMVVITDADTAAAHRGVYKVISVDSDSQLTLDTSDGAFTTLTGVDFYIIEPSMKLQYKWDSITVSATTSLTFADANPDTITRTTGSWITDGIAVGDVITITGSVSNNGSYTVAEVTSATVLTLVATDTLIAEGPIAATATANRGFVRSIGGISYAYKWRLFGNTASAANCYQFIQHQLRQTTDIDFGPNVFRGDVNDLLMAYASPTGTALNLAIDDLDLDDINNVTFRDATTSDRLYPFVSSVTLNFNDNLQGDANAKYWVFFTNDDAGDNLGRDYGTKDALLVINETTGLPVTGNVGGSPTYQFTYDYTSNIQRGAASAGTNAPITVVAIGLSSAQFVITTGLITQNKGINVSLVSALERNYSNP